MWDEKSRGTYSLTLTSPEVHPREGGAPRVLYPRGFGYGERYRYLHIYVDYIALTKNAN